MVDILFAVCRAHKRCFILRRESEDAIRAMDGQDKAALDPDISVRLIDALTRQLPTGDRRAEPLSVVLASADLRRIVWTLLAPGGRNIAVLSHQEISRDFRIEPIAVIGLDDPPEQTERSPVPAVA